MSESVEVRGNIAGSRLAVAIREVKNAFSDRDDVVIDIREAQLTRLELLADDLKQVFSEIPKDDDRFDLAISAGAQPRLWIDAVAHVTMARDRRTYRFLHDRRLGRVVLYESSDFKKVADQVTRYIAGRVIERERMLEGDTDFMQSRFETKSSELQSKDMPPQEKDETNVETATPKSHSILRAVGMILLGGLVGMTAILAFATALGRDISF